MSSIYPAGHIVSTTRAASPFPPMFSPEEAKKAKNTHFIDRLQSQPVASQAGHHHIFSPKEANEAKATHVIDGLQSQPVASQAGHAGCHQGLPACYRLASAHIIDRLRQPVASPSGHADRCHQGPTGLLQAGQCTYHRQTSESACIKPSAPSSHILPKGSQ